MKSRILLNILIVLLITSCGAPKVLVLSDKQIAENATAHEDYTAAVTAWQSYFQKTDVEEIAGADFAKAAKTAYKNGDSDLAFRWFNEARYKEYSDFEMYKSLAEIAQKQSNISRELSALEFLKNNFPTQAQTINKRLFELYTEIDRYDAAVELWDELAEDEKSKDDNLLIYFELNKSLKDSAMVDSIANVLLVKNPNQKSALEWNAKKFFWIGENRYQEAMDAYNKNKTTRQYRILLSELEQSTEDFKKALTYFEKLWEIEPGEKYASYFATIYARFGDEEKSKTYQKYLD